MNGKTLTRKELANAYGISIRTMYNRLKSLGFDNHRQLLSPNDINLIFEKFGMPTISRDSQSYQKKLNNA